MSEFKKGDRVKHVKAPSQTGTIRRSFFPDSASERAYAVDWDDEQYGEYFARQLGALIATPEAVAHPAHYGGDTAFEVIKVAEAWGLDKDAYLFNLLKYIGRNGKKAGNPTLQDLRKGSFYLNRRIQQLEAGE